MAGELRVLVGKLRRRLREQASVGDLTESQLAVLRRLEADGAATASTLARGEGMRPQSMGSNVAALQAAGLVSGSADPSDGRQTLIDLTPACKALIRSGRATREHWLCEAIEQRLNAKEQQQLDAAIALLARLAEA
jgi:DNA-binding MarR family transcriptional regulator